MGKGTSYYIQREGVSGKRRQRKNRNGPLEKAFFTYTPKNSNFIQEYYGIVGIDSDTDFHEPDGSHISPNPYAVGMARNVIKSITNWSNNKLTALNYFVYMLKDLAKQMEEKEKEYLRLKIFELEKGAINIADGILDPLKDAYKRNSMSEAYSLLLTTEKSFEEIERQLQKAINFHEEHPDSVSNYGFLSRMNGFWERVDLNSILDSTVEGRKIKERIVKALDNGAGLKRYDVQAKDDFEKIAKEITKLAIEHAGVKDADVKTGIYEEIRNTFKRNLLIKKEGYEKVLKAMQEKDKKIRKEKLQSLISNNSELEAYTQYSKHVKRVTKNFKSRDVNAYVSDLLEDVRTWALGEQMTIELMGKAGAKSFGVGKRMIKRQDFYGKETDPRAGTTDNITLDTLEFVLDNDSINKDLVKKLYAEMKKLRMQEIGVEEFLARIKEIQKELKDLFVIKTNTKSYKSNMDLGVVYDNSIKNLGGKLTKLSRIMSGEELKLQENKKFAEAYHLSHQKRSLDNLISMLNNVFEKGYMHDYIGTIKHWIAAACFVWMWDGVEEDVQEMIEDTPDKLNTIYLFQSGGAFFSASQIIKRLADSLLTWATSGGEVVDTFARVTITPTTSITDQYYAKLRKDYPVSLDMGYAQQMEQLKKRWDSLRNEALKTKLSVSFNQRELDKLLGNLSVMNHFK